VSITQTTRSHHCSSVEQSSAILFDRAAIVGDRRSRPAYSPSPKHDLGDPAMQSLGAKIARRTVARLTSFGNVINSEHERAIELVCSQLEELIEMEVPKGAKPIRKAFALPAGAGKTTIASACCAQLHDDGYDYGVLIAAERIEQLGDFIENMHQLGVPKGEGGYGAFHSGSREFNEIIESTDIEDLDKIKFLAVSHARMERNDFYKTATYKGEQRRLLLWDESLISTTGSAIDVGALAMAVAGLKRPVGRASVDPAIRRFTGWAEKIFADIEAAEDSGNKNVRIEVPAYPWNVQEVVSKLRSMLAKGRNAKRFTEEHFDALTALVRNSGGCDFLYYAGNAGAGLLTYVVRIPDELSRIAIFDASANIRQLQSIDKNVEVIDAGFRRDHCDVNIEIVKVPSGRESMRDDLDTHAKEVLDFILESDEPTLVGYRKAAPGDESFTDALRRLATARGISDLDNHGCKGRVAYVQQGRHKASNQWNTYKRFINAGLMRKDHNTVAAETVGQRRDVTVQLEASYVNGIAVNEVIDMLYQMTMRCNCRNTKDGKAGKAHIRLRLSADVAEAFKELKDIMFPGSPDIVLLNNTSVTRKIRKDAMAPTVLGILLEVLGGVEGDAVKTQYLQTQVENLLKLRDRELLTPWLWRNAREAVEKESGGAWARSGHSFRRVKSHESQ